MGLFNSYTSWAQFLKEGGLEGDPSISLKINMVPWPSFNKSIVLSANINMTVGNEASVCQIVVRDPDASIGITGNIEFSKDISMIKVGAPIEVAIGRGSTKTVFEGFISKQDVSISFTGGSLDAQIIINAMDAKMWMMTSKKTEIKNQSTKFSQAVSKTLTPYASKLSGTQVKIGTEKQVEYICQNNESDYEFLCKIADLTGSLFYISLGKLYFLTPKDIVGNVFAITPGAGILSTKVAADVWGTPSKVTVMNVDEKDPSKTISANSSSPNISVGSGKAASSLTTNIGLSNVITIVDPTIKTQGEAQALADAEFTIRSLRLSTLKIETLGINCLELGTKVTVSGFGDPIDNTYILTGIDHDCDAALGTYNTTLQLSANKYNPA